MSHNRTSRTASIGTVIVALIVVGALVYFSKTQGRANGASRGPAVLEVLVPEVDSKVFINNKRRQTTTIANETFTLEIGPGSYEVMVAKDGYWPWKKRLTLTGGETTKVAAFTLPMTTKGYIINKAAEEYATLNDLFDTQELPTLSNKKISNSFDTNIWVQGSTIYAEWVGFDGSKPAYFCDGNGDDGENEECGTIIAVINPKKPIKNVGFWKNRNDILIFSTDTGVYVIDIDKRGTQNFQPLYEGTDPEFFLADAGEVFVRDNGGMMLISQ